MARQQFHSAKAIPKNSQTAGYQLDKLQHGQLPTDWKPMPSIGPGAAEIRIHEPHEHRVIFVAKFDEAIYVLHAFGKKTQRTSERDLNQARLAYAELQKLQRKND